MAVTENVNTQPSAIAQMNEILIKKEELINEKKSELEAYRKDLEAFEKELQSKVKEVQQGQIEIEEEKKKINAAWDEIRSYEEKLQATTNEVLAEKIKLEQMQKELLEKELSEPTTGSSEQRLNLSELRASIGLEEETPIVKNQESVSQANEPAIKKGVNEIPELFKSLEKEIAKACPKWSVLEMMPDRYCLKFEEKEIRFFDKEPVPEVQIVIFRRNAKADKRLQTNLVNLERVSPEWQITTEENRIIYTMPFTKETKISVVLKKCNEFIKANL